MKLSRVERWMLSNQYRILEALYPDEAEDFQEARTAIENGYEGHYDQLITGIYDDVMSEEESDEVLDILSMFDALKTSYTRLNDKAGIEESNVMFWGFDGNNESKQLSFTRFFCNLDGGRFTSLDRGDNFNSHGPFLVRYRRMLIEWKRSNNQHQLSKDDIIRITSV